MNNPTMLEVSLGERSYPIYVGEGLLSRAGEYMNLSRRVLIVTDEGVPREYAETVASLCEKPLIFTVKEGEGSKSFAVLEELCRAMLGGGFTRADAVVAVGGGVVGDLAGFAAASYMRGIDFYNIPTTLLSQVDSSIGGKVAVNLDSVKNAVGAFYQPRAVLIDPAVLKTLPARQISAGLAEALKMAACFDSALFELFERNPSVSTENVTKIIVSALKIKKDVVEKDEKESSLRRALNFGHTVGHGIESVLGVGEREDGLYHGECVALGMLPMCSPAVRARLLPILKNLALPTDCSVDANDIYRAVCHDKKAEGDLINAVFVEEIGTHEQRKVTAAELTALAREVFK